MASCSSGRTWKVDEAEGKKINSEITRLEGVFGGTDIFEGQKLWHKIYIAITRLQRVLEEWTPRKSETQANKINITIIYTSFFLK
jgi:hypothetical protein